MKTKLTPAQRRAETDQAGNRLADAFAALEIARVRHQAARIKARWGQAGAKEDVQLFAQQLAEAQRQYDAALQGRRAAERAERQAVAR